MTTQEYTVIIQHIIAFEADHAQCATGSSHAQCQGFTEGTALHFAPHKLHNGSLSSVLLVAWKDCVDSKSSNFGTT